MRNSRLAALASSFLVVWCSNSAHAENPSGPGLTGIAASYELVVLAGGNEEATGVSSSGLVVGGHNPPPQGTPSYATWEGGRETVSTQTASRMPGMWTGVTQSGTPFGYFNAGGGAAPGGIIGSTITGNFIPEAVNASGMAVGYYPGQYSGSSGVFPETMVGGKVTVLPTPADTPCGWANDVNDSGVAVGNTMSCSGGGLLHAVRWEHGSVSVLPQLPSMDSPKPFAVNNAGIIVGSAAGIAGGTLAVMWPVRSERGGPSVAVVDLGTLGCTSPWPAAAANDINSTGVVVGTTTDAKNSSRAFAYKDGVLVDLNTRVNRPAREAREQFWLITAVAINDAGWILCSGWNASVGKQNYLLKPSSGSPQGTFEADAVRQALGGTIPRPPGHRPPQLMPQRLAPPPLSR